MERNIQRDIQEKLREIEEREQVTILRAVESGSRAWGIASPDSDYDVRFVYVRNMETYLRLEPVRDVIEWQLDEVLDINGWDLKKVLVQFQRGNATLFEWANSPVVYRNTEIWNQVYNTAKRYFSKKAAVYHYYGTANKTYLQYLQEDTVKYKKYFYALRPLLAARYINENGMPAPVLLEDLMGQELPEQLRKEIREIMEIKLVSGEAERKPQNPVVQQYIREEIGRQKMIADQMTDDRNEDWETLDRLFLKVLRGIKKAQEEK